MAGSSSSKAATTDKARAQRAAQHDMHGGLVVLRGGGWNGNVLWADHYDALAPDCSKRAGYERTEGFEDNPLGYGRMRVYRFAGSG